MGVGPDLEVGPVVGAVPGLEVLLVEVALGVEVVLVDNILPSCCHHCVEELGSSHSWGRRGGKGLALELVILFPVAHEETPAELILTGSGHGRIHQMTVVEEEPLSF